MSSMNSPIPDTAALLPCPFCGGGDVRVIVHDGNGYSWQNTYEAQCFNGDCQQWQNTEAEAIQAWNRRAAAPSMLPQSAGTREAFEAWASRQEIPDSGGAALYLLTRRPDGNYEWPATDHAWLGFQAGTASLPSAQAGKTGWPAGMLQDDSPELSRALASKPDARLRAREAAQAVPTHALIQPARTNEESSGVPSHTPQPLTDEQIEEIAARIGSMSLHATRAHELGGMTRTILDPAGVIEFARAIEAASHTPIQCGLSPMPSGLSPHGSDSPATLREGDRAEVTPRQLYEGIDADFAEDPALHAWGRLGKYKKQVWRGYANVVNAWAHACAKDRDPKGGDPQGLRGEAIERGPEGKRPEASLSEPEIEHVMGLVRDAMSGAALTPSLGGQQAIEKRRLVESYLRALRYGERT